jgi:heme-degrading monooxygenase HmoA
MSGSVKNSYYAVIFTSEMRASSVGYEEMAQAMLNLARKQPGYLGVETARGPDGTGITVSYWRTEHDIQAWRQNAEHGLAQEKGRQDWYSQYRVRVCKVEREYGNHPGEE